MHGIAGPPDEPIRLTVDRKQGIVKFIVSTEWMETIIEAWRKEYGEHEFSILITDHIEGLSLEVVDYDSTLTIGKKL